jgi:hypothetical protein
MSGYEVRNPEIEAKLKEIGEILKSVMPEGWGFMLLIASVGGPGSMFYMSDIERQSMIDTMREFIHKFESQLR